MSESECPSCGVAYIEHLGLAGTCAEVLRLREAWLTCRQDRHDMETRHQREVERLREALELTLEENTELIRALEEVEELTRSHTGPDTRAAVIHGICCKALQRAVNRER